MSDVNTRSRAWVFTVNNWCPSDYELLMSMDCRYMVVGKEVGDQGVPHLQGYVMFKNQIYLRTLRMRLSCWWQPAMGDGDENFIYCSKGGDFVERGVRPLSRQSAREKGGESTKEAWELNLRLAKEGRVDEVSADVQIKHYSALKAIQKDNMRPPEDVADVTGVWLYGPAGCGKSFFARRRYPDAYLKNCNKWWDGYKQEANVIIDDFDKVHGVLGHHLKIWGDRYGFMPEVKCGLTKARPLNVVVTSNYHPRDIWDDNRTLEPILRRYRVIRCWKDGSEYQQEDEGRLMNGISVVCVPWCNLITPVVDIPTPVPFEVGDSDGNELLSSSLYDILNT